MQSIDFINNSTQSALELLSNVASLIEETPMGAEENKDFLYWVSFLLGWIYFVAWSVSFYGQVYENFKNGSVSGLSFDFQVYNFTGFLGYTIYTVWGFIDPKIGAGKVSIQDVFFAAHALAITIFTLCQIAYYYDKTDPNQKVSHTAISVVVCLWWGFLIIILCEEILKLWDPKDNRGKSFIFNSVIYLGWLKVFISLIKYIPQVLMNVRRKSTVGWSIHNILLDFTGGSLSLIQNIIDTIRGQKIISPGETYTLNIAKYAISCVSIVFDIIFMIQHFWLFKKGKYDDKENTEKFINESSNSNV